MIPLIFAAVAALVLLGCTVAGTVASVAGSVISTTAEVTGAVIGGAARTVSGSDKSDRDSD
jgi:phosphate/sulfate permease